jgi:hypothetical protein
MHIGQRLKAIEPQDETYGIRWLNGRLNPTLVTYDSRQLKNSDTQCKIWLGSIAHSM